MMPWNDPIWNVADQRYWFKMCRAYKYPVARVREPFRALIESEQDETWEADYQEHLDSLSAPPAEYPEASGE